MASILTSTSIRAIERGIRQGKCLTVIPDRKGSARIVESAEFLSAEESEALLKSLSQPTPGDYLERFIWEHEDGVTKAFAAKTGYHPNRISALKSSRRGISARLFRRMAAAYKLSAKERDYWTKRLLDL
jgi:hypothetical protein